MNDRVKGFNFKRLSSNQIPNNSKHCASCSKSSLQDDSELQDGDELLPGKLGLCPNPNRIGKRARRA